VVNLLIERGGVSEVNGIREKEEILPNRCRLLKARRKKERKKMSGRDRSRSVKLFQWAGCGNLIEHG